MRSTSPKPHEPGVWQKMLFKKTRGKIYLTFTMMVTRCYCQYILLLSLYAREGKGKKGDKKGGKKEMTREGGRKRENELASLKDYYGHC